MPHRCVLVAMALGAMALTGCSGESAVGPRTTIDRFAAAWAAGDGATLCGLLAEQTSARVASDAGKPCPEAIKDEHLHAGRLVATQVWGRAAQARTTTDVLFLTRAPDGWRITAAGCRAVPDAPYDCRVEG